MKKFICLLLATLLGLMLFVGCSEKEGILVVMPDGAPALSMAELMSTEYKVGELDTEYRIVSSDSIAGLVANRQADLAVLPLNLATKVCGNDYQILSVMTFGNLYLVSNIGSSIYDMVGHNLYVINLNNVPGLTTKIMLQKLDIEYSEVSQTQSNVMLIGATAQEIIGGFQAGRVEYAIVAEPAVSMMLNKVEGLQVVGDVQEVLGEYPQSVLVVKKGIFSADDINYLIEQLQNNAMFVHTNYDKIYDIIVAHLQRGVITSFQKELITSSLVARCNVGFELAIDHQQKIDDYITALRQININSADILPSGAYYDISA